MVTKLLKSRNFPSSYDFAPIWPRAYLGVSLIRYINIFLKARGHNNFFLHYFGVVTLKFNFRIFYFRKIFLTEFMTEDKQLFIFGHTLPGNENLLLERFLI